MNKDVAIDINNLTTEAVILLTMALDRIILGQYSVGTFDKIKRGIGISMGKIFDLQEVVYKQYPELDPDTDTDNSSPSRCDLTYRGLTECTEACAKHFWMNEEVALSINNLVIATITTLRLVLYRALGQCADEDYLEIKQGVASSIEWMENEILSIIYEECPELEEQYKIKKGLLPENNAANK